MASLLPIFLDLNDQSVLLIGGKNSAAEKLHKLIATGAKITVVARNLSKEVQDLADSSDLVTLQQRLWQLSDLRGQRFIVSAVDDREEHQRIADAARSLGILVNTVDSPSTTDCYLGAQVERGPLLIAISTHGRFPGLARALKIWINELLPEAISGDIDQLAGLRDKAKTVVPETSARMAALREQLDIWLGRQSKNASN